MPPRGPKPTPTSLKIVRGNPGKRALNKSEPKPTIKVPTAPQHLCDDAKAEWKRVCKDLAKMGILSELDRAALAAYSQAYGRWVKAERALAKMSNSADGLVIQTKSGNMIQNPLVGVANKAMADMMRYCVEFGMTPSARTRISAEGEVNDDPFAQFGTG